MADDHEATMFVLLVAAGSGYVETVQALITHNPRLMNTTHCGFTPLTMASQLGSARVVHFLLNCGVDVGVHGADGDTALHCAARRGRLEIVGMLLRAGANVASVNGRGEDCLVTAAAAGQAEVVEMLLTDDACGGGEGGSGDGGDVDGATVAAAVADHVRVLCLLVDAGADPCTGSYAGRSDAVRASGGDDEGGIGGSSGDICITGAGVASPGRLIGGGSGDGSGGDEFGAAAQVITMVEAHGAHKCARVLTVWGRAYELCKARRIRDAVLQLHAHAHTTNLHSLVTTPHHTRNTIMGDQQKGGSVEGWRRWLMGKEAVRVPVYLQGRLHHGGDCGAAAAHKEQGDAGGVCGDAGCGAAAAAAVDEYVRAALPDVQVPLHQQNVPSVHATDAPITHTSHTHSNDNTRATCKRTREGHAVFEASAHVMASRLRCAVVAHVLGKIGEELFVELMTDVGALHAEH